MKNTLQTEKQMIRTSSGDGIIGMDLGDRWSRYCIVDAAGTIVKEDRVRTTPEALAECFEKLPPTRIVIEAGMHSPWVSRLLEKLGHQVIVTNARKVRLIYESQHKNDRVDARMLAKLGRVDVSLLAPIQHRSAEAQTDLVVVRGRDALVAARTQLINAVRGVTHVFDGMEAYEIFLGYNLTGQQTPEHVSAARATPGFFNMIGVNAAQGRTFLWQDDTPNAGRIVLLSEKFATRHFPTQNPLGQRLLLDGAPHTIVGVLPKNFHLPAFFEGLSEYKPDIWLPLPKVTANDPPQLAKRRRLVVWGRLKQNVSLAQAREDMKNVAGRRQQEDPELNQGFHINLFPLQVENTLPDFRSDLRVFSIAASMVLLLACLNLTGLVVIRVAARNKNFAIMAALGASRTALISPMLSETALLTVISTLAGYFAAYGAIHLIAILKPNDIPGPERLALNFHSLIFTSCLSVPVALIVTLLSAHTLSGGQIIHALKSTTSSRQRTSYLRSVLITVQITAAVTLTITAILLIRSFQHILNLDQGFAGSRRSHSSPDPAPTAISHAPSSRSILSTTARQPSNYSSCGDGRARRLSSAPRHTHPPV